MQAVLWIECDLQDHARPYDLGKLLEIFGRGGLHVARHVENGVGVFLAGLALHILDVDPGARENAGKLADGVRDVAVDHADPREAVARHGDGGKIDGIADVPALEVFRKLGNGHARAVVLRFGSGGAQVRHGDDALFAEQAFVRKIRRVAGNLARFQGCEDVLCDDKPSARKVEDADAVLHLGNGLRADHALRIRYEGHVDGDVIARGVDLVERARVVDGS